MAIGVQQFPILNPDEMSSAGNLLQNSLQKFGNIINATYLPKEKETALRQHIADALIKQAQAKFAPEMEQARLFHEKAQAPYLQAETNRINTMTPLDAKKQEILNYFLPRREDAEINLNNANTSKINLMTPLEAAKQKIINHFLAQRQQSEIRENDARTNYYNQGGSNAGVGQKEVASLRAQILRDNPGMNPEQANQAAGIYLQGGNSFLNGDNLPPLSGTSQAIINEITKRGSTSALITAGVKANAAESEMPVIDKAIQEGRSSYGNTYFGTSPQQVKDSINSNNPKAAERIGNYIASDMLAFDKAALQTRIAGTESGVTIIEDVMQRAKQNIIAKYPHLSDRARQVALEKIGKTLKDALAERNKYGIGASGATGKKQKDKSSIDTPEDTRQIGNETLVKINGKWFYKD